MGWDLRDEDSDLMRNLNGASPDTPPACWPPFATSTMATRSTEQLDSETQDAAAAQLIRDAQPADSPWVRHPGSFVHDYFSHPQSSHMSTDLVKKTVN